MPGWHNELARTYPKKQRNDWVELGLIQEQHPARCQLFMQWQKLDFAVLVDAYNLLGVQVVPITLGIDEHGIVRTMLRRPGELQAFLDQQYEAPEPAKKEELPVHIRALRGLSTAAHTPTGREKLLKWLDARIADVPTDGAAHFARGVALRQRAESAQRKPGDFQAAVAAWQAALDIEPNQYIWRRRIQQYGPKLAKPYPFYDWVASAIEDLRKRGETPVELPVPLTVSEKAGKATFTARSVLVAPDPDGRVTRDERLIESETTLVPSRVAPGATGRLHIALRPRTKSGGHWNNEAGPTQVWIDLPPGWETDQPLTDISVDATRAVSDEVRMVELEFRVPPETKPGEYTLSGYAVYNVCTGTDQTCLYRRQDWSTQVNVGD